jgi:hypothetical protein
MRALPILLLACVLCACGGGGGGDPQPPPPSPAGVVSGLSPFPPSCGVAGGGTSYVNAEVEPYLAVDPRDANHLIAVWQQDRWSNGSARGLLSALSLDGGVTWSVSQAPFAECTGGTAANGGGFQRATDPWVTISPDGTAYQMGLVTNGSSFAAGSSNAMTVSRSTDGGRTWSNPVSLITDGSPFFNDKNAITADPLDARFVYAVWDRLQQNVNGPAYFARTTDGGATWEPAKSIFDPGSQRQTIGNLIRVLPNGTLVNLFTQLDGTNTQNPTGTLRVIRSTDRGATWSAPTTISSHQPLGARDPATARQVRDGSVLAQMAAGPDGSLHVVWQDARFTGVRDSIAYSRSADAGLTWTAPVRVNANPGVIAFMPQVHVLANGTIGVAYYDFRSDTPDPATLHTDYWLARSSDGVTWTETRVAGPFDLLLAPDANGLFLGDYMGLEGAGTTFLSLHVRTTGNIANRTDVFFTRVPAAAPGLAFTASGPKAALRDAAFERRVAENFARAAAARRVGSQEP